MIDIFRALGKKIIAFSAWTEIFLMCFFLALGKFLSTDAHPFFEAYSAPVWNVNVIGSFLLPILITQWWFQLMKSNVGFLFELQWCFTGEWCPWNTPVCDLGKKNRCQGKLVETTWRRKKCQDNVHLFYYMQITFFCALPFTFPCFVFFSL